LGDRFRRVRWGSQGDDWLWILHRGYRLEIDSFYSLQLEVKGPRKSYGLAQEVLHCLPDSAIITVFEIPKLDLTASD
ncbi:MAG: hypothetical protein VKL20_03050, partial [Synechocystis sp.]|nr:hypothetical protein [Synechocystis sp.]